MIYAIDASGSMWDIMHDMIHFVQQRRRDGDRVLFFDTSVVKVVPAASFSILDAAGYFSGTRLQPVFDWMRDNAPRESLAVITDGYWFEGEIEAHGVNATCYLTLERLLENIRENPDWPVQFKAFRHIAEMKCEVAP